MNTLPFTIHLPVYEGAIDLLLYIVRQRQLDLAELPLAIIANDFLIYARTVKNLDLDDAGEIIFVAALLLSMKARSLLPGEEEDEAVEEEVDRELSEALEEVYREIVAAAQQLARNEAAQRKHFPRGAAAETVPFDENIEFLKDVNLILWRKPSMNSHVIWRERMSVRFPCLKSPLKIRQLYFWSY